jgi:hypothetical protein
VDPLGLAFNSAGNLFVANDADILEFTPGGVQSIFATDIGGEAESLAFDCAGNLFVTSKLQQKIYEVTPDGTVNVFATGTGTRGPLAFDSEGDLFTALGSDLYEFKNYGGFLSTNPILFSSALNNPKALAFDSAGDLFESDLGTESINEFVNNNGRLSSTPVVFASGLHDPWGLAFALAPEPSTLGLLAAGTAALLIRRNRKRL